MDSLAVIPLVQAILAIRSRARIIPRITRRGIESSEKPGQHRWIIERSFAWLTGYHRLTCVMNAARGSVARTVHPCGRS